MEVKRAPELAIEPLSPAVAGAAVPGILRLLVGGLVIGQQVEVVLRVRFPDMPEGAQTTAFFTIGDRDGVPKADGCTLAWQHASQAANDDQPRDRDVDRAVARIHAARAGPRRGASTGSASGTPRSTPSGEWRAAFATTPAPTLSCASSPPDFSPRKPPLRHR